MISSNQGIFGSFLTYSTTRIRSNRVQRHLQTRVQTPQTNGTQDQSKEWSSSKKLLVFFRVLSLKP